MKHSIEHPAVHVADASINVWHALSECLSEAGQNFRHWFSAGLGNPFTAEADMRDDIAYVRELADDLAATDRGLADDLYAAADRAERANNRVGLRLAAHH